MTDPYKVLGISYDASDEEVKVAYRNMAKKYHPDNFAKDEAARSIAEEKMKEINEAYDLIQDMRKKGKSSYGGTGSRSYDTSSNGEKYNTIRNYLNYGNVGEADNMLNDIPYGERNAEWYFLKGCVCASWQMTFDAVNYFQRACELDPNNLEYRSALNNMKRGAQSYTGGYNTSTSDECSGCDMCSGLLCADCMCEMCGGDLIGCC